MNTENSQNLPSATVALVMGIFSLVTCWCYGVVGLLLGIVGFILANKDTKLLVQNPTLYKNGGTVRAARILSIIGIILNLISLLYFAWIISRLGLDAFSNPEQLQERLNEALGQ